MDKHEALLSLEKAHKLRKHADKLEKQAYEILDEKKEHEVKASFDSEHDHAKKAHPIHTRIAALHSVVAENPQSSIETSTRHAKAASHHGKLAEHYAHKAGVSADKHMEHVFDTEHAAHQKFGNNPRGAVRAIRHLKSRL